MTKLQHQHDSNNRVVKAAPHPKDTVIDSKEYYMVDPPSSSESMFLAYPGRTHAVWYTASFGNDVRVDCHVLENWHQVDRFITESLDAGHCIANTPQQIVADLRKKADDLERWLEKNPQPPADYFQGMPYRGMEVWVEHPGKPGTLVCIKVTGTYVSGGEVCIATEGWKYFRPGHWFWTKEAGEKSLKKN